MKPVQYLSPLIILAQKGGKLGAASGAYINPLSILADVKTCLLQSFENLQDC